VITRPDVDKLRSLRAAGQAVLSVYLTVPLDLAEHRGLPTRARELIKAAAADLEGWTGAIVRDADTEAVSDAVQVHGHEWLGHTVAIFACADIGLFETIPLPGFLTERGVIAARPFVRPLLAAIQRNPAYRAAVIDNRHAWIFSIADDRIETVASKTGAGVPSQGFAGWYGLQGHRIQQRIMTLARRHFKDTVRILERTADDEQRPLVLGGHENEINRFVGFLPRQVRESVAGTFHADLATMTPARVRELAGPVLARFQEEAEARLVSDVLAEPPSTSVMTDLEGCIAASRSRAVAQLILPDDAMIPGHACDDCGAIGSGNRRCDCPDPVTACRAVPDVLDELACQTLDRGGEVVSVREAPFAAAARLRFGVLTAQTPGRRLP
jgi:hypothetical protein